jgi:urease accessory protein
MLRCTRIHDQPLDAAARATARVLALPYEERVRHRLAAMLDDGTAVAIVLHERSRGTALRDGTVLAADSGEFVIIKAAAQPLARVTADAPLTLLRAVYHLANRHTPVQLAPEEALIERDPVLERMLLALGARIEHVEQPFDPEPGAYEGHAHGHGHTQGEAIDEVSASLGEQLSIAAHQARLGKTP